MKLSTKLKFSFCVLILVPVILFGMTFIGIMTFKVNSINLHYNTSGTSYDTLTNPVVLASSICQSEYNKLLDTSQNNPNEFMNGAFLEGINKELAKRYSYLIVEQNGLCTYSGNTKSADVLEELKRVEYSDDSDACIYLGGDYQIIVERVPFITNQGSKGNAYIIMQINELIPQMKMLFFDSMIAVVLILVLTSALFTTWIYKETVAPINKLKLATYNIKNGNLDFDMDVDGKDEISELCRDFDAMRVKLKENAEEKLKYDAENKILISNISHDLKTPITAIKGYVEGLMDGVADTEEKRERYIRTIYNKACDMDKLIDELTFYSKIDTNRMPYVFKKINVKDYFGDCVDEIGDELEAEGIELKYSEAISDDTRVIADAEQMKRVVNNIVGNSVKYMNTSNGIIKINITEDEEKIYIEISDNGKGVKEEDLPKLFDRFYRGDASRNSSKGGSGIGLSIVKKIISDHGGSIIAEAGEDGIGLKMKITLARYYDKSEENTDTELPRIEP